MTVSDKLLNLLACPRCRKDVRLNSTGDFIICDRCGLKYPVEEDIPVMLEEKAEKID